MNHDTCAVLTCISVVSAKARARENYYVFFWMRVKETMIKPKCMAKQMNNEDDCTRYTKWRSNIKPMTMTTFWHCCGLTASHLVAFNLYLFSHTHTHTHAHKMCENKMEWTSSAAQRSEDCINNANIVYPNGLSVACALLVSCLAMNDFFLVNVLTYVLRWLSTEKCAGCFLRGDHSTHTIHKNQIYNRQR